MNTECAYAIAYGVKTEELIQQLLEQLPVGQSDWSLGFVYATDALSEAFGQIVDQLSTETGVRDWVGTVGLGVCGVAIEVYEQPAVVVLLTNIDSKRYCLFDFAASGEVLGACKSKFAGQEYPSVGVIHGRPTDSQVIPAFNSLCDTLPNTFFVGGLSSSQSEYPQVARGLTEEPLSGVLFGSHQSISVAHSQGCLPLSAKHVVTACEDNRIDELDGRPALEVFKEDIGEVLAKDLKKIGGYIFAGFPLDQSDINDYIVRNIIALDIERDSILVGDQVHEQQAVMFCRRDGNSAQQDMQRMLDDIKKRLSGPPRGALYYSCLARGRYQFGEQSEELKMIAQSLGNVPLVGFFANGEIYHHSLYGYTGVLTVFE